MRASLKFFLITWLFSTHGPTFGHAFSFSRVWSLVILDKCYMDPHSSFFLFIVVFKSVTWTHILVSFCLLLFSVAEQLVAQHNAIKMLYSRVKLILEYIKAVEAGSTLLYNSGIILLKPCSYYIPQLMKFFFALVGCNFPKRITLKYWL